MKVLRDPLLHFVVLGGALFLVYAVASDLFSSDDSRRVEITKSEIELLASGFERQWRRPPTEAELRGLVDSRVREEVLYRAALAVGLDRDDVVVRRRMVQKMELLTQDLASLADPTDEELRSFFEERREDYNVPPRVSFSHVYFNTDRRGAAAEDDARRLLAEIRAKGTARDVAELGDRFMLQHEYALQTPRDVGQLFGKGFADALFELEPGWHGPIASGYGIHLVNVTQRVEKRVREFEEIRDRLVLDYNRLRRDRANEALYEKLVVGYVVEIDETALKGAALAGVVGQ